MHASLLAPTWSLTFILFHLTTKLVRPLLGNVLRYRVIQFSVFGLCMLSESLLSSPLPIATLIGPASGKKVESWRSLSEL